MWPTFYYNFFFSLFVGHVNGSCIRLLTTYIFVFCLWRILLSASWLTLFDYWVFLSVAFCLTDYSQYIHSQCISSVLARWHAFFCLFVCFLYADFEFNLLVLIRYFSFYWLDHPGCSAGCKIRLHESFHPFDFYCMDHHHNHLYIVNDVLGCF